MFAELLSIAILGGKYINEKIGQDKPYKHVMNTPREVESRKRAEAIYEKTRRDYEKRTGKKADW